MVHKEVIHLVGKTFIYYSNKGKVLRITTGILWKDRGISQNEKLINGLVKKLQDIISNYQLDHDGVKPSRAYVSSMMKGESPPKECLMDYYREFLDYKTQEVANGNLQPNSLIDYRTVRTILLDYEKVNKTKLQLLDLSEDFMNRFQEYLLENRNLNNNTAFKRMKLLKAFLNYCEGKHYFRLEFSFSKIKMKEYNPTVISLTESEYCHLRDWHTGKYEKVKAVFIFGCLTSLKFSNIKELRQDDIINDQICIRSAKTNTQHFIPLPSTAKAILLKYNYNLNFFTNQTYNRLLKKMAKTSGFFNSPVTVVIQKGSQKLEVQKPKWECFGSQLARRVNITRNIDKNLPLDVVMDIAGLKRMDTVFKYMDKSGVIKDYSKILEE